ncbi:MAG: Na/Pi cotransporter family protein [Chitinophagaceae bacterium]|nr:Na/Pi cotransporter family protein [Chitinophagaceae bacterium]
MSPSFDIWKVLAGVAIFLLGVRFLEESLQQLAGRRFKLYLKKQTASKIKAIGGGALVTGVLQSSSVVSLMVLAFVGAGIITMPNALAVILGANLGTTITGWIVALAGFNFNIENMALPVTGIAGLGFAIFNKQSRWYNWSRFLLGFSFLFVGLGYMKTGIEGLVLSMDLQQYAQAPLVIFLVIGFMITSLIQSSSATVAITLSALYAGAFTLNDGIAIVLGSEIGTTMKLFVASIKGSSSKRRVALGNFLFNVITVLLVLIFLFPLSRLVTDVIGIKDKLIALVFFQTLVNIIGIILFYPLLNLFARFLENRYRNIEDEAMFIHKVKSVEPSLGIFALENESRHFLHTVLDFTWSCFEKENSHAISMELHKGFSGKTIPDKYAYIKFLHGEIHTFYIQLQKSVTEKEDIEKLDRLISSVRNGMYAAKSIKDAIPDMDQLRNSANDIKYNFFIQTRQSVDDFCNQIYELLNESPGQHFEKLTALYHSVTGNYSIILHQLYRESTAGQVSETEISTMINFNREVFTAFKSLVFGVKDYLFDKKQSGYFDDLPGFIR